VPEFLEKKLESEYGKDNPRVYATMNAIGAMRGSKETEKGRQMERKHRQDLAGRVKKAQKRKGKS
jgi:hypothetical protein